MAWIVNMSQQLHYNNYSQLIPLPLFSNQPKTALKQVRLEAADANWNTVQERDCKVNLINNPTLYNTLKYWFVRKFI